MTRKRKGRAKGSRLLSLLLRPEGGWSAGWDRTRWLVARQPDFLSLSLNSPSLYTRSLFVQLSLFLRLGFVPVLFSRPPLTSAPHLLTRLAVAVSPSHQRRSTPVPLLPTCHPLHPPERRGFSRTLADDFRPTAHRSAAPTKIRYRWKENLENLFPPLTLGRKRNNFHVIVSLHFATNLRCARLINILEFFTKQATLNTWTKDYRIFVYDRIW